MQDTELGLESRRLKLSEFLLGIFAGIIISVFIEAIVKLWLTEQNAWQWIIICIPLFPIAFLWYKRIVGYPDFIEYSCSFFKNEDFSWKEFISDFSNCLKYNLDKKGSFLGVFHNRLIARFTRKFKGYDRGEIRRTKWGNAKAYIYLYRDKQEFKFLIGVPSFSDKHKGILDVLKETIESLEKRNLIKSEWNFSLPRYYHMSYWYPIMIKGKQINRKA